MKSVLISIQPKWCELIASGKKTVDVRKTRPKLQVPFKVYIYCTKDTFSIRYSDSAKDWQNNACGKVIGEFICDGITMLKADNLIQSYYNNTQGTCLTDMELCLYAKEGKPLYYWHISNLVIYDKPRELGEFYRECEKPKCEDCPHLMVENTPMYYEVWCPYDEKIPITRPPQSWCYVEEAR